MRFRWTTEELKETSDEEIIRALIVERQSDCTGNSPLYRRLEKIYNKISIQIKEKRGY